MKVTKLTAQQKNKDRVNVFVDGKYELSLSLDQVLEQKLKTNSDITDQELKKLHKISADGKIRTRALEWVLSRPHSQKELIDYLKRKGAEPQLIENIANEFALKGYQNETEFTKWWVDNRLRKNKSNREIRLELRQKGVDSNIIDQALNGNSNQKTRIKQLIESKKLFIKYPEHRKLINYLSQKGFSYSDIAEVVAELKEVENF
ncbi:MAG: RecX family transcriptional regulator [Patescibacteria group bacterium]|nr:RecX family transcriptional regulator [Patescibacteria group bacterium]